MATLLVRASVSSIAATIVDGVVYQGWLFAWPGRYGVAAAAAAVAGAVTNFILNRSWAFADTDGNVLGQALRYVLVSGLTFLCLRGLLWLLIERMHVDARVAWLPAKVLAFLLVSYPMQRWWVFKPRPVPQR
ncbi:MAG TPA: GtrA family protein [Polyangia bacterium]|nr:GtrA family protein [Polyangia bacterium]